MSNLPSENKPIIGFTCGDVNGIGVELIIKVLSDNRLLEMFTPVIFCNNKVVNFYRKSIPESAFSFSIIKDLSRPFPKQVNILNCWEEDVNVTPGIMNEVGGKYAVKSLVAASEALKEGKIQAMVTAPIHKKNIQDADFKYTGHTPFLKDFFEAKDVVMFMVAENIKVGLVTEHVAVKDISANITREVIVRKLQIMHASLQKDFGISKPSIGVLGLNPHSGDEGLIGKEDEDIIKPAVKDAKQQNMLVVGPFSADAFFARGYHEKFDAVLAMYHDQGLIPFKSLGIGEGVNYTAGLNIIRTSPDHGTAFDIAGKNKGNEDSLRAAVYTCLEIIDNRKAFAENRINPLKRRGAAVLGNAADEKILED